MSERTDFIICNRAQPRWTPAPGQTAWVELEFASGRQRRPLHDIGTDGVSFVLPLDSGVPERGSRVCGVTVHVDGSEILGDLVVSHVTDWDSAQRICGAQLLPAAESDRERLELIVRRLAAQRG